MEDTLQEVWDRVGRGVFVKFRSTTGALIVLRIDHGPFAYRLATCAEWCGGTFVDVMSQIVATHPHARWWARCNKDGTVDGFCSKECLDIGHATPPVWFWGMYRPIGFSRRAIPDATTLEALPLLDVSEALARYLPGT